MRKKQFKKIGTSILSFLLILSMVLPSVSNVALAEDAETSSEVSSQSTDTSGEKVWDFTDAAQADDFTLYKSGDSTFSVADGVLKPDGTNGEMKAITAGSFAKIKQVSVDIIPGTSGVNAGVYIGASNAADTQDQIDALTFLVESNFDDANRIDVVAGEFQSTTWTEYTRRISSAETKNAIYSGEKKALTLVLDFEDDNVTATLSLQGVTTTTSEDKYVQTVYYCDTSEITGQIGLRANGSDVSFDNFTIKYEPEFEESLQEGLSFTGANEQLAWTDEAIAQIPNTIEMWVKMNDRVTGGKASYRQPLISSINPGGSGATQLGDFVLFTGTTGMLYWYEAVETTDSSGNTTVGYVMKNFSSNKYWNGEWMHVAITREAGIVTLYVNGEFVGTVEDSALGVMQTPQNPITFGYSALASGSTQNNLDGSIGDVRLWNTTRTQEDIKNDMYRDINGDENGLMHCWKFDEQSGTTFYDSVTDGINGQITETVSVIKEGNGLEFVGPVIAPGAGPTEPLAIMEKTVDHIPQAIELWVKIDEDSTGQQETLISAYSGQVQANAQSGDWYLGTTYGGYLRWVEKTELGQSGQMNGSISIQTGKWTHVAVVRYEGSVKFYIDGQEDTGIWEGKTSEKDDPSSITIDPAKTKSTVVPTLGVSVYNTQGFNNFLDGSLRDVRLWDVDRTQEQIQADMDETLTGEEEGLMHYWKLDEVSGSTFKDSVSAKTVTKVITNTTDTGEETSTEYQYEVGGNNGTIKDEGTNTKWIVESVWDFPGINLPLVMADKPVEKIPKTLEMQVKIDSESKATIHALMSTYNATTQNTNLVGPGDWQLDVYNGTLRWVDVTANDQTSGQKRGNKEIEKNQWVHVAVTREANTLKFYVDGELDITVDLTNFEEETISYTTPVFGYSIFHTATTGGGPNYFDGSMKDIRIWNVPRTAEEIAANKDATLTGTEPGLMNYWKMDEQDGIVFKDSTASNNYATPTVYWSTLLNIDDEEEYTKDGFNFTDAKKWQTTKQVNATVRTVEAWVKVPTNTGDYTRLTIVSAYPGASCHMDVHLNGKPRLYYAGADGTAVSHIAQMDIRNNKWTHIAWVCDDVAKTMTCYINGEPVTTNSNATNVGDAVYVSNLYVGRDNRGGWEYPFVGKVADVRVWETALTAEEVQYSMHTSNMNYPDSLLLDLPLDEASDATQLRDLSKNDNPVEVYERNLKWLTETEVETQLAKEYAEKNMTRQESEYSIAVIPDQQILTDKYYEDKLVPYYQWIADNVAEEKENIQMVLNVGDITNNNSEEHWKRAKAAYDIIADDVPYICVPGNHDYDFTTEGVTYRDLTNMNKYFPLDTFSDKSTYGGSYSEDTGLPDDVANTWQRFEIDGHKYLVIALEFGPRDSVLEWANRVVAAHPNHQTIVLTHGYVNHDGTRLDGNDPHVPSTYSFVQGDVEQANNADVVWDKFVSKHNNIIMVFSGHIYAGDNVVMRTATGDNGNEVKEFLIDAQALDSQLGGLGLVAMLNFSNGGKTVEFTYYSPSQDAYMNTENQFIFTLPELEETNKFVGSSLTLDGTISYNFFVNEDHTLSDDAYVEFVLPRAEELGAERQSVKLSELNANAFTNYGVKFKCSIPAKEMADTITANIYNNGELVHTKELSVRDYAEILINNESEMQIYAEATPLMKSMLDYGAYSQTLFDYNTEDPANTNYTSDDEVQSVTVDDLQDYKVGYQGLSGFGKMSGATLVLKGETTLRMFFEFESGANLDGLKFTVNGTEQECVRSGKYYIIDCTNIAAKDLDKNYTVVVSTDAGEQFSATCSAMTFCYIALSSSDDEALKNVSKALHLYNIRAERYMEPEVVSVSEYYNVQTGAIDVDKKHGFDIVTDTDTENGMLTPPGASGEGKVMLTRTADTKYQSMSVDIYPGKSGIINSGFYLGATEAEVKEDSIHAIAVMAESFRDSKEYGTGRVDITIGSFYPWTQIKREVITEGWFNAGEKKPLNLKVEIDGQEVTVTISVIDDASKTRSVTFTCPEEYNLATGQVGLRSQIDDSSFDNLKVTANDVETIYDFDDVSEIDFNTFTFYHSTWRGQIKSADSTESPAAPTFALHSTAQFTEGTLSVGISTESDGKNQPKAISAGIVFGADEEGKNYYMCRVTNDRKLQLVKVTNGTEAVLVERALSTGYNFGDINKLEIVREDNRIYCYCNNSGRIICFADYEDDAMLSGNGIGLWAEDAGVFFQNIEYKNR